MNRFKWTFIALLTAALFFVTTTLGAQEKEWKPEVPVSIWCYQVEVFIALIEADKAGAAEESDRIATSALENGICRAVRPPLAAAFSPKREHSRYTGFGNQPIVIIEGNMVKPDDSEGEPAFIIISLNDLYRFIVGAEPTSYQEA